MYGITSYLPTSFYGIQNYGGEQYLWWPLQNNDTISLNICQSSKYIYYGTSNITVTLPAPSSTYLESSTIQIFVATQNDVTVKGSGCKFMYTVDAQTKTKDTISLSHWGLYTFVYMGTLINFNNCWVCSYNTGPFST